MTEYDYSPEAYKQYMDNQQRVGDWVSHSNDSRDTLPFAGYNPTVPLTPKLSRRSSHSVLSQHSSVPRGRNHTMSSQSQLSTTSTARPRSRNRHRPPPLHVDTNPAPPIPVIVSPPRTATRSLYASSHGHASVPHLPSHGTQSSSSSHANISRDHARPHSTRSNTTPYVSSQSAHSPSITSRSRPMALNNLYGSQTRSSPYVGSQIQRSNESNHLAVPQFSQHYGSQGSERYHDSIQHPGETQPHIPVQHSNESNHLAVPSFSQHYDPKVLSDIMILFNIPHPLFRDNTILLLLNALHPLSHRVAVRRILHLRILPLLSPLLCHIPIRHPVKVLRLRLQA
ncbi:hypothetical protein BDQ17DRAFT_505425 [Cyathus striatus]|nr:hypothetical protein BDQ17DRAFT_505425 [Cyathus striatus]